MYQEVNEVLSEINIISVIVRLTMAVIFGGIIGVNRTKKGRPAGLRTYMLVCMGATLVALTNIYTADIYGSDPTRLSAQVISGIGFLGASSIIVTRHHQIIGLTTAAGLWVSVCVGLAIGIGFYEGVIVAFVFVFLIMSVINETDSLMTSKSRIMEIYVEFDKSKYLSDFLSYITSNGIKINHVDMVKARDESINGVACIIEMKLPKKVEHIQVIDQLKSESGLTFIKEV